MRIFVARGFNPRDEWIPELVYPIIRAFDAEVADGEASWGGTISDAVIQRIEASDGLIAFLTRRGSWWRDRTYKTHRWVLEEFGAARQRRLRLLEVRETKVDEQDGMGGDHERITYDPDHRDRCLVKLTQAVSDWAHGKIRIRLLPQELVLAAKPLLRHPDFRCLYRLRDGNSLFDEVEAPILPLEESLVIDATGVPRGALIQIRVRVPGQGEWVSSFHNPNSRIVPLERNPIA